MINASAVNRTINSARPRILRRRTVWYGIRRTNISDGNCWTIFFSRWVRWIRTGIARAARPTKKRGAKNAMVYLIFIILALLERYRYRAWSSGFDVSRTV